MGFGVASWTLFLHILLILLSHGGEARQMSEEQFSLIKQDSDGHHPHHLVHQLRVTNTEHIDHATAHDHISPPNTDSDFAISSSVFFKIEDMKAGKRMALYFPKEDPIKSGVLPKEKADLIPFSLQELPHILKFFSFPPGSPRALAIEDTLRKCEDEPVTGETRFCATSMESMLDFVLSAFGLSKANSDDRPTILTTTFRGEDRNTVFQNYTILEAPEEVPTSRMIGCHTMPYPYTIFHCHTQEGGNKVYKMPLRGDNGDMYDTVSVCHQDTSEWDPNHLSFRKLGVKPGIPVCHFFPPLGNFMWVHPPTGTTTASV